MICKHKKHKDYCGKCFDEKFGKPDPKTGKREGFAVTGEKTGGKW